MADRVDGAHRAGRHHDLFGHGGDPARGVPLGDHRAQRGQPCRVVAVCVRVRGQFLQGALDGAGEPRFGRGQGRRTEVDHRAERLGRQGFEPARGKWVTRGHSGPAARTAPGLQEALGAQRLVGGGDRGAADGEGEGQFALGGEAGGDRHPSFQHQQADAIGEGAVGGRATRAGTRGAVLLGGEQPGELRGPYRRSPLHHVDQSTFPELAMDTIHSQATGCHVPGHYHHRGQLVSSLSAPDRLGRRLLQLYAGLALYGASSALLVESGLGLEPWGVLHQGLAELTGLTIGVVSIFVGAVVLLLWIPLRQRPGLGTVSNVFVVGLAMDGTLALVPDAHALGARVPLLVAGIVLNGVATGLYIAASFGPGPRDGLMTGLHRITGRSIRLVRTAIEVAVVATGFALGGTVGIGTVLYAVAIGPLAQLFLRVFAVPAASDGSTVVAAGQPEEAILRP